MEITYSEMALILWGAVATTFYMRERENFNVFKAMTIKTYILVARRKAEIVETNDGLAVKLMQGE